MTKTIEIYGLRARQARLMRRLTAKSVMDAVGWSGARLSRLERADTTCLSEDELQSLTEVLRFPARFFTATPVCLVEPDHLLFRTPKSTTETEKNRMAQFIALSGDFLLELDTRHKLPPVRISAAPDRDPIAAARHARQCLGVEPDAPISDLTHLLERGGIPVVMRHERFGAKTPEDNSRGRLEKHLGCSTWVGEFQERPLIVLRELDSWERTRWTLAHELGHLVLHTDAAELTDEHEDQASRFASEFLAPFAVASKAVKNVPSLLNLIPVKQKWGISIGALLRHFYDRGALDEDRYEMLRTQLYTRINADTGFTWGRTEPGWDERLPERPRLMSKWIEFAYGVSSPEALAAHQVIWPLDVLHEFLVGQRYAAAPVKPPPARVMRSGVADFAAYRQRRA
ncbi:helix-turn-helix domain-containing protein [Mycobacteroides franklinii]|uniref:helix-turn-helix domain-containing protein n=2 Tax=Mycobacteriaceae TaxID=1762 RepID=UPI00099295F0|nr:ImmA/IrrE family metallo-endopeptidase [Mycobacteroides franklinii]MDM2175035.1 ImmA/IrrE family metallo-endopeptidase [Mycobacteroides abscessus]SKL51399.1 DNA-binding protein [Mycobacteroides abscessus subsp. bolletii]MDM2179734.1 ImmA/IrrE family metallo-endopeptidase [Mycobacteroides abscessus]MDM2207835.1 ImmA/IrrE family metallo-endopeptidase [Mycobacteroides abscessus]MDM2211419.1 ImmA/IrrE family metallo-endopeptidase [Mycobacteroides abscessus]